MKTVVFIGPTASPAEVTAVLPDADVRGPAACGDVLRVVREGPATIALIDGLFEHRLPVWHKELLWALSRGCPVYGASSMGALRAAELAAFGMMGVGQIFAWYRDGLLEDDDEVAVAHEEEAGGYRVRSDAMVNVRATLARAVADGALDAHAADALMATVKATPYPQRNLRQAVGVASLPEEARAQLSSWLGKNGLVDQKHADAMLLLQQIAAARPHRVSDRLHDPLAGRKAFAFSYTETFHELVRSLDAPATAATPAAPLDEPSDEPSPDELLEELQMCGPARFHDCWQAALERALARALGRSTRGESAQVASTNVQAVPAVQAAGAVQAAALAELPEVLHARGLLEAFAWRAADKSRLLEAETRPAVRVASDDLVTAHFSQLGLPVPENLEAYAQALGFEDQEGLIVTLARERWYLDRIRDT
jgi:hypothetical protein